MLTRLSIRIRLTVVFAGVMAIVLLALGAFVYERVGSSLSSSVNRDLDVRADDISALTHRAASGDGHDFGGAEGVAQLLTPTGKVARATPDVGNRPLLTPAQVLAVHSGPLRFELPSLPGFGEGHWRVLARPVSDAPGAEIAVVAASLEPREEALDHLFVELLVGGAAALLLASAAGYGLAAAALRPVEEMSRKAAAISLRGDDEAAARAADRRRDREARRAPQRDARPHRGGVRARAPLPRGREPRAADAARDPARRARARAQASALAPGARERRALRPGGDEPAGKARGGSARCRAIGSGGAAGQRRDGQRRRAAARRRRAVRPPRERGRPDARRPRHRPGSSSSATPSASVRRSPT